MRLLLATATILLVHAPAALAGDGEGTALGLPAESASEAPAVGSGSGSIVRTIIGLLIVVGVIYGLSWILRRTRTAQATSGTGLASLATLPLGENRSLQLVRAGAEIVLLGVAEHGLTPIRTYTEDEARALGLIDEPAGESPAALEPGTPVRPATASRGSFIAALRERTVLR